ncbi:MAG: FAD-dependent oxidoreductase [Deltaproteobacteria bacterium]|nr:FAD-dependent oxidoreductase [Deltaproteobacteria bacterium]
MRIVVIGGVAAGMSAASQAKRRAPSADVVVFERGGWISYASCGIPYNLIDPARTLDDLVVLQAEEARKDRGIDVRVRHEVLAIRPDRKVVEVRDLDQCAVREEPYDRLIVATGAAPVRPPLPGIDLPGVFVLRTLPEGAVLKRHLAESGPREAAILGGGYIGMEMAEALRRRGLAVTILERAEQILAGYHDEIARTALEELRRNEVRVQTGVSVAGIAQGTTPRLLVVQTDQGAVAADLVLVATGIRPDVALARAAGLKLGPSGAIAVDDRQRTNVPHVFAAGDCAEATHRVSGLPVWVPLGTTANKQGKIAGANAAGADERFAGIVGSAAFKLFDIEVGRTGLGMREVRELGLDAVASVSRHRTRGHSYPGSRTIRTVLFVERETGRLLGAQMAGGDAVAKRIDVFAAALQADMTVSEVEQLDLTYAPPFAPVYDPILIAAGVAMKDLAARKP